jgi:hypothetical protein
MAGLFGLFGGKKSTDSDKGSFFLDKDDAKTFGDIDYMRATKTVKRTFARKKGVTEELESVKQVSAMESNNRTTAISGSNSVSPETAETQAEVEQVKSQRRNSDRGMDMFRNMARDIRK